MKFISKNCICLFNVQTIFVLFVFCGENVNFKTENT